MANRDIVVYNRFWRSRGGGERHLGAIAQALAADGEVTLLGHDELDLDGLGAHLDLDLSRCRYERTPDRGEAAVAQRSAGCDLFVNGSYGSRVAPRSRRAAYLCYFPTPVDHDLPGAQRRAIRGLGPLVRDHSPRLGRGTGWFSPEGGFRRAWTWTADDAVLHLPAGPRVLHLDLGRPGTTTPVEVLLADTDGRELARLVVTPAFTRHVVDLGPQPLPSEVHLRSPTWSPGELDDRQLGIAVSRARLGGPVDPRELALSRWPWLRRDPRDLGWLERYDCVLANSAYTQGYVESWWRRAADVLHPPVSRSGVRPAADREQRIVTLGRFFAPGGGHAKRQLELVQAFARLDLPGWSLSVIGGCEPSAGRYLAQVQAAAAGLDVEVIADAPRAVVDERLSTASIFWSATGLGEDTAARPWTAEHFGMSTVEAMAGGCVPVVIDSAGQREIVRDGIDGLRWDTVDQLVEQTRRVAGDAALRARLAASALERSQTWSEEAFLTRLQEIVVARRLLG